MSHSELDSTYLGAFIILLLATCSFSVITFLSSKISKKPTFRRSVLRLASFLLIFEDKNVIRLNEQVAKS